MSAANFSQTSLSFSEQPIPVRRSADWLVLRRVGGAAVPMSAAVGVARAMRGALMKYGDGPIPALVSGHSADGGPLDGDHLARVLRSHGCDRAGAVDPMRRERFEIGLDSRTPAGIRSGDDQYSAFRLVFLRVSHEPS